MRICRRSFGLYCPRRTVKAGWAATLCKRSQTINTHTPPAPSICPIRRIRQVKVEVPDARTAHSHDGSPDDSSESPEAALEDCGNADDDRTRVAAQTLRHAVRLQIHRVIPAAPSLDS